MSSRHNAKHNTTRSKHTSDKRPKLAQKQLDKYHDMTGGMNDHKQLNSTSDRGQTLGSGPWGQGHAMGPGSNIEPWQDGN